MEQLVHALQDGGQDGEGLLRAQVIAHGSHAVLQHDFRPLEGSAAVLRRRFGSLALEKEVLAVREGLVKVVRPRRGLVQHAVAEIDGTPVMGVEQEESQRLGVVPFQNFPNCEEVPQRLGHLLRVHVHKTVVHPEPRELVRALLARSHGLGQLVLVVGEGEVQPTPVDVDLRAQQLVDHRTALDVPPGSSLPPRALPEGLSLLLGLPQRKVGRIPLPLVHRHPLPRPVVVLLAAAQAPVIAQRWD
mmetsp:Transcript_13943/g.29291  ORF Transcript_13943/g.29291 Transcript_13943/m.29291 type:complete len:245 (+) Transcript_13943:368-1102(+)